MEKDNMLALKKQGGTAVPAPVEVFQPKVVVAQAHDAANALKQVLDSKQKKVMVNGERYLEFEDWQLLGRFYGITAGAIETKEIVRDGKVAGFSAKAVAWSGKTQISVAEASCLREENNWFGKPEFQLKSMAQTRACVKVLRNVLAWVAVLAGYKPTPAEELTGEEGNGNGHPTTPSVSKKCQVCGTTGRFHRQDCPNWTPSA